MPPARRILLIRPSALGDVCRTVPVLAALRRAHAGADIAWVVRDSFAEAVVAHPALSRVIPFPRERLGQWWRRGGWSAAADLLRQIRPAPPGRFDAVIDCQGLARSAALTWLTGAGERIGYADARELAWLPLTHRVNAPRTMHTVDRMMALAGALGVRAEERPEMRLYVPEPGRRWARTHPALAGVRYAVVAPTSRWGGKRWPEDRFARLVEQMLCGACGTLDAVALVGAGSERGQCPALLAMAERDPRVVDLVGRTTVGQLMGVVERAAVVVANDSACLHMAVGLDRPLVALFGPTSVALVGPYGRETSVVQHVGPDDRLDHKDIPAGRALMERISTDEVASAVANAVNQAARTASY